MMTEETIYLSQLAATLEGSQILQYANAVKAMRAKGANINNYTVGDFDPMVFPIPIALKNEVMKAYAEDYTNYPVAEGNPDLRQAIAGFEKRFGGIEYGPEEIVVGSGGRPLIYAAFRVICDKGDGVIFGTPSWNNHYFVQTAEARGIEIRTEAKDGFLLTADKIEPHLRNASLLCLCSPQNPTGTVYPKKVLQAITDAVVEENNRRRHGKKLYVLFDAMYGCLAAGFSSYNPLRLNEEIRPYLITVNAVSKIFAATGMRVGWCLGPEAILHKIRNLLTHVGAWAPMAEQKAVARFLVQGNGVSEFLWEFREGLQERLDAMYSGIMRLKRRGYPVHAIRPQGGIYLSVKINLAATYQQKKIIRNAHDAAHYLLEHAGFAVLPFAVFGSSPDLHWFRISVGTCRRVDITAMFRKLELALHPFQINKVKEEIPKTVNV